MSNPSGIEQVAEAWRAAKVRTFSTGDNLPTFDNPVPESNIEEHAPKYYDELREVDQLVDEVYEPGTDEHRLYKDVLAERFDVVSFLHKAKLLNLMVDAIEVDPGSAANSRLTTFVPAEVAEINNLADSAWGKIDPSQITSIVARARKLAGIHLTNRTTKDSSTLEASERLLVTLPEVDRLTADDHIYLPSPRVMTYWDPVVRKKFASIIEVIPEKDGEFKSGEVCDIIIDQLRVMENSWGLHNAGQWNVETSSRTSLNVDSETKTIKVPEKISKDYQELVAVDVHELGHLLRNLMGELIGDPLLESGTRGRGPEEESFLSIIQQILEGKPREAGLTYYLAIGLARDVLQTGAPLPNDQIESLLLDYQTVLDGKALSEKMQRTTRGRAFRVERNLPQLVLNGKLYQVQATEDQKYRKGQKPALGYLEGNIGNPTALDNFYLGKFAFSMPDQFAYAQRKHAGKEHLRSRVPTAA